MFQREMDNSKAGPGAISHLEVVWPLFVLMIFGLGLAIRTIDLGTSPFQNGDDVSTAWAATWYFPRGLNSFRFGDASLAPNPFGIFTLIHGPLPVLIAWPWIKLLSIFGVPITERMWHLPFAFLGSLIVPLCYLLGVALQSKRAGFLAAALVSVAPLHAAFSRTSGESHFILASLIQTASLLVWWRYLLSRRNALLLITGLLVSLDMFTDFMFPGLFFVLVFSSFVYQWKTINGTRRALTVTLSSMKQWRFILPVSGAIAVYSFGVAYGLHSGKIGGMLGRVISEIRTPYTNIGGGDNSHYSPLKTSFMLPTW